MRSSVALRCYVVFMGLCMAAFGCLAAWTSPTTWTSYPGEFTVPSGANVAFCQSGTTPSTVSASVCFIALNWTVSVNPLCQPGWVDAGAPGDVCFVELPAPPPVPASGVAMDWGDPARVAQVALWSFVVLVGFHGFSVGLRSA